MNLNLDVFPLAATKEHGEKLTFPYGKPRKATSSRISIACNIYSFLGFWLFWE